MKITIIGAGSSYTPELMEGLINNYKYLEFDELCLTDVKFGEKKLSIIYELTKRMFKKKNINIKITKTLDQIKAIKNANFIVIQLRVGGLETRIIDETIPLKYGLLGQETNGFGGMFKAFRTIPVIFDLIDKIKKYAAKDVWVINFSNPAGIVTEAVHKYKKFKNFVGVCNVPIHLEMMFADCYKVDKKKVFIDWIGLNHFVFGIKVKLNNKDITSDAVKSYIDPKKVKSFTMRNVPPIPWEPNFVKSLNMILCPYFRYFVKYNEIIEQETEELKHNNLRSEIVKKAEETLFEKYKDINLDEKPKELEMRGGAFYSKVAIEVLTALAGGPSVIHAVDYPNDGTITNYPKGDVIEVSSKIEKNKITQLKSIKKIPETIYGSIINLKNYQDIVIKAAINGDYGLGLIAANISPFSRDDNKNKIVYDELMKAHKKYLPTFNKKKGK